MNMVKTVMFISTVLTVLLALTLSTVVSAAQSTSAAIDVLFDTGHELDASDISGYSSMITDLTSRGFSFTEDSDGDITEEDLSGKDILVIVEPDNALSTAEINNIQSFVAAGHGLLLMSDELNESGRVAVNTLLSLYNIQQSTSTTLSGPDIYTDITSHAITIGVSRYDQGGAGVKFNIIGSPASSLIKDGAGDTLVAAWQASGRVVATSDEGSFRQNSYNSPDNSILMRNILDWLSHIEPPVADFSAQPITGEGPLNVQFTDESMGNFDNWQWDFGDGTTSNEQNPSHLYYHAGRYTVSLEVTGVNGTNTEVKQGYIHVTEALGKVAGVQPSGLMTSSIKIETTQVLPDEEVTVSIDVTNYGVTTASYQAILSINGKLEDSQVIDVSPGASQTIVFVTTTTNPGLYEVSIDGHSVQFIVTNSTPTEVNVNPPSSGMTGSGGLETSTINAVIAGSVGAAVAIVLVTRRRRRRTASQDLEEKFRKILDDLNKLGKHD